MKSELRDAAVSVCARYHWARLVEVDGIGLQSRFLCGLIWVLREKGG